MIAKYLPRQIPQTVDEAAQFLLSDLLIQHLQTLSQMTEQDFDRLYEYVTPYLIDEFKLWQGNDALLDSCLTHNQDEIEPARVILDRVKEILSDFNSFIVII